VALHASIWQWILPVPFFRDGDAGRTENGGDRNLQVVVPVMGGGVTYWVMPHNIFISGNLGIASMLLNTAVDSGGQGDPFATQTGGVSTSAGASIRLHAGKEWWVGSEWALGVGLALEYLLLPDQAPDVFWHGSSAAVTFVGTFN